MTRLGFVFFIAYDFAALPPKVPHGLTHRVFLSAAGLQPDLTLFTDLGQGENRC